MQFQPGYTAHQKKKRREYLGPAEYPFPTRDMIVSSELQECKDTNKTFGFI